ncbi:ClpXP protease specificity-enhancing factor [Piscinibacter sakaiensis]|nr:ClpXP protease specificity-enhancing factor [Piscinibacter sakaiensis]
MSSPPAPPPVPPANHGTSTRPYLIRALHDWCTDNGFTPYIAVYVDASVQVPLEYVKNNEIVLNVGFEATTALKLGNDWIEFKARFGGSSRDIVVPVDHVIAIYARENGQGMAFPVPTEAAPMPPAAAPPEGRPTALRLASDESTPAEAATPSPAADGAAAGDGKPPPPEPQPPSGPRPALKRIK